MTMMKMVSPLLVALAGTACGPVYQPMAAHTIAVGENQEVDVIWVQEVNEQLLRCQSTPQGPVCQRITMK